MGLQTTINESIDNMDSGGVDALVGSLKTLADVTRTQYKANQSQLSGSLGSLLTSIRSSLKTNRQQISPSMNLAAYIKNMALLLPVDVQKKYSTQLNQIKRQADGVVVENVIDQFKNRQEIKLENMMFQQAVRQDDLANMKFDIPVPAAAMDNQNAIQRSVRTLRPLLRQKLPSMTGPSQIPNSIRYLSKFAAMQKKIPIGQVTDQEGLAYVGLQTQDMGNGLSRLVPYKKPNITKTDLPNIPIQFIYHASKTMNSWNQFVEHQAKFVKFVNQISTPTDRSSYVEKQFKNLNLTTFAAEVLATLVYYYVYIPTQRYLKQNRDTMMSQDNFLINYTVGALPSINPLLLTSQGGVNICKLLLNITETIIHLKPTALLDVITIELKKHANNINKKQMIKLFQYIQKRRLQTMSFFQTSGVDNKIVDSLLAVQDFSSVRKKKFILNTGYQNNQFVLIVQKVTSKKGQNKLVSMWDFMWGSQFIPCHDYIWKN